MSVDLDADHALGAEAARADLQRATGVEIGDHFDFALTASEGLVDSGVRLAVRYALESSLAGRPFEPLQVDVTLAPPEPWDGQPAQRDGLLSDLGLGPIPVLLIPIERQVAEPLHACTRAYGGRETTSVEDLVDLLLVRRYQQVDVLRLQEAITGVFDRRGTHRVPESLPPASRDLALSFRREAARAGSGAELDDASRQLADWLNPVLRAIARRTR